MNDPQDAPTVEDVVARLRLLARPEALAGMARFGIATESALGVSMPDLRALSKSLGRNHALALELWRTPLRETRILASLLADARQMTEELMESWTRDFADWEVCDQCCINLFGKTSFARHFALTWSGAEPEFVKRAGFVLMARIATTDRRASDASFEPFFTRVTRESTDRRNYVRKAVNWALRQIGKRDRALNEIAIAVARTLAAAEDKTARLIGSDALRELTSPAVRARLKG
jgi:3-methyladenine DNA glycosylase AlkD